MEKFIRQAKEEVQQAEKEWRKSDHTGYAPTEIQSYVLFVCGQVEIAPRTMYKGAFAIASSPTASDFAPILKKANLALLAKKYAATGFVVKRTPKGVAEWEYIPVKGGAK